MPRQPDEFITVPAPPPAFVAGIETTLSEIAALQAAEALIRLRLLRSGVVVPRSMEQFR